MTNLDDLEELKKLDPRQVSQAIGLFTQQIDQAWSDLKSLNLPEDYRSCRNIVVAAMGGSGIGIDLLANLYKKQLSRPLQIVHHYELPAYVNQESLVILSSYSGTTEEVLVAAEIAKQKQAKIFGVCEGGPLSNFLKDNSLPAYIFEPKNNPSGQPRLGTGYTMTAVLALLTKLGFISLNEEDLKRSLVEAQHYDESLKPEVLSADNPAKQLARELLNKAVLIVAAEFLSGNAHIFANQTNENAKNFASYFLLPELNHHLLEGLTNPTEVVKNTHFVFLESSLYSQKLQKRVAVTKEVLQKQGLRLTSLKFDDNSELTACLKGTIFSSWTSYYLGCLYGIDASQIPWVDYFKKRLSEN